MKKTKMALFLVGALLSCLYILPVTADETADRFGIFDEKKNFLAIAKKTPEKLVILKTFF